MAKQNRNGDPIPWSKFDENRTDCLLSNLARVKKLLKDLDKNVVKKAPQCIVSVFLPYLQFKTKQQQFENKNCGKYSENKHHKGKIIYFIRNSSYC